jgi:hypothetical protein
MNHGDPQSTGRSRFPGPILGVVSWKAIEPSGSVAGVAVSQDSLLITGFSAGSIQARW